MNSKWHDAYRRINALRSTYYALNELVESAEMAKRADVLDVVQPLKVKLDAEWEQAHADQRAAERGE